MSSLGDVFQSRSLYNTNTSDSSDSEVKHTNTKTLAQVQMIACKLEATLGKQDQSRYDYYCKVAWRLPEHIIWNCLESAMKGRSPVRLFSYLTAQYLK